MFRKLVFATTLGVCLFGVSFGQNSDGPPDAADREAAAAESGSNQEVKVAMLPLAARIAISIAAGRAANPVTPLNKGENSNSNPGPKASPQRDAGRKGGNGGSRPGGGRKIGPN